MRNKRVCCPKCEGFRTKITCLRVNEDGTLIRRYRKCEDCEHMFRTTQPTEVHDDDGTFWFATPLTNGSFHRAVFTPENIRKIRSTYKTGLVSQQALADMYGVSQSAVSAIVNKKFYKHVT